MNEEVYLDKIKLGALIVEKELNLIELFNRLIMDIRQRPDLMTILNEYPDYQITWRNLVELYDFLENDYAKHLNKEDNKFIKEAIESYRDLKPVTLSSLKRCVGIVRRIMSISKFHDLIRKNEYSKGLDKVNKRYHLKDNEEEEP